MPADHATPRRVRIGRPTATRSKQVRRRAAAVARCAPPACRAPAPSRRPIDCSPIRRAPRGSNHADALRLAHTRRTDAACACDSCGVGYRGCAGCYPPRPPLPAVPPEPPRSPIVLLHMFRRPFPRLVSERLWCTSDAPAGRPTDDECASYLAFGQQPRAAAARLEALERVFARGALRTSGRSWPTTRCCPRGAGQEAARARLASSAQSWGRRRRRRRWRRGRRRRARRACAPPDAGLTSSRRSASSVARTLSALEGGDAPGHRRFGAPRGTSNEHDAGANSSREPARDHAIAPAAAAAGGAARRAASTPHAPTRRSARRYTTTWWCTRRPRSCGRRSCVFKCRRICKIHHEARAPFKHHTITIRFSTP